MFLCPIVLVTKTKILNILSNLIITVTMYLKKEKKITVWIVSMHSVGIRQMKCIDNNGINRNNK